MTRARLATTITLLALLVCAPATQAARIEIPLRLPIELVRQSLGAQLGVVYRDGPCRYLETGSASVDVLDGKLHLAAPGKAALGVALLGNCQSAALWRGSVQFTVAPYVDGAGRLRVRILDSSLTDESGAKALGAIWDLSRQYLHPRLERFSYDLGASRATLLAVLRSAGLEVALAQVRFLDPRIESRDILVPLAIDVPDAWLAAAPPAAASAAPLSDAELAALDEALQPWDAFLVFAVKQIALDVPDARVRERLFTLLLESRYQLVSILAGDAPAGPDPLRSLFVDSWNELRSIAEEAERSGGLDNSLLRYAMFVDSGDALLALDRAAPALGVRVSADGLRQLARSLSPGAKGDPLAFGWVVDPQLRQLFGVEDLERPSFLRKTAYAPAEGKPLDPWVPGRSELDAYEGRIDGLLREISGNALRKKSFDARYEDVFRNLVPTTALIESCWHQYVRRGSRLTYLRSRFGSVGIMQINQHVWRGFFDLRRLRWDTAYNARAGAQILMRYMKDYAIPYSESQGDPSYVARATYAVYNAGPRSVGRFTKKHANARERRVDERLWSIYQGIAAGGHVDLATCGVSSAASQ